MVNMPYAFIVLICNKDFIHFELKKLESMPKEVSVLYLLFRLFCFYSISVGKSWMYVFKEYSVIFLYLSFVW